MLQRSSPYTSPTDYNTFTSSVSPATSEPGDLLLRDDSRDAGILDAILAGEIVDLDDEGQESDLELDIPNDTLSDDYDFDDDVDDSILVDDISEKFTGMSH